MLDSVFEELAHGCKMGDSQAMLRMYQWFWSRVPDELKRLDSQYAARCSEESEKELEERLEQNPQEGFRLRAAYTWLTRAAFYGSQAAMDLICQAAADGSIWLCAICAAPNMLARHGLIDRGRRAVCYPGMEGALTEAGVAACMDQPVVVDGTLITGRAPGASFDFALALLTALRGEKAAADVQAALHYQDL